MATTAQSMDSSLYASASSITAQTPTASSSSASSQAAHPISMKVMRLRRPEFQQTFPLLLEPTDLLGDKENVSIGPFVEFSRKKKAASSQSEESELNPSPKTNLSIEGVGYSDTWTLPNNFGKIYVGETFSCYISLHNHSYTNLKNVSVKTEIFTGNYKQTLLDLTNSPITAFAPGTNHDYIVEQPLGEQGTHMLVCIVTYEMENTVPDVETGLPTTVTEQRNFRKLFKFPVSNPLGMKTVKVYTFNENVFVHLELQNLTDQPLYVDYVKLDPSYGYKLIDHSTHNTGNPYEFLMQKNEVRRLLYQMVPKDTKAQDMRKSVTNMNGTIPGTAMPALSSSKAATALGKIELSWKNNMGESGTLVTNTINHKGSIKQEIDLEFVGILQNEIFVEEPFEVVCNVWNRTVQALEVNLLFETDKMYPLATCGKSIVKVGIVEPFSSKRVTFPLFALATGVQGFGNGIVIRLPVHDKNYAVHELSQFFIQAKK